MKKLFKILLAFSFGLLTNLSARNIFGPGGYRELLKKYEMALTEAATVSDPAVKIATLKNAFNEYFFPSAFSAVQDCPYSTPLKFFIYNFQNPNKLQTIPTQDDLEKRAFQLANKIAWLYPYGTVPGFTFVYNLKEEALKAYFSR